MSDKLHDALAQTLLWHVKTLRLSGRNDGMVEDMERAAHALANPSTNAPAVEPLTDESIRDIHFKWFTTTGGSDTLLGFARAIEAELTGKTTAQES